MAQINRQDTKDLKEKEVNARDGKKYLTAIKELPPDVSQMEASQPKDRRILEEMKEKQKNKEKTSDLKGNEVKDATKIKDKLLEEELDEDERSSGLPLSAKDIVLIIVNLISVVLLVIILLKFPEKSEELKRLRVDELKSQSNIAYEAQGIEGARERSQKLNNLFLDESGVVGFVNDLEGLRGEGTSISKINFGNPTALRDKSENIGIPLVVELTGAWDAIDRDLQSIDNLPYLFRPVNVEISRSKDDSKVIIFKYGVFLYVNDSFGKNR